MWVLFSRCTRTAPSPPMVSFFTEWLNRECAVAKDNVASIRIHNCNMALAVNCACADQSFERADGHSRKEVFLTFGVCAWEERAELCLVGLFLWFPVTDSLALVVL